MSTLWLVSAAAMVPAIIWVGLMHLMATILRRSERPEPAPAVDPIAETLQLRRERRRLEAREWQRDFDRLLPPTPITYVDTNGEPTRIEWLNHLGEVVTFTYVR